MNDKNARRPEADGHQPLLFFVVILSQLDDAYQIDAIVVGFNNVNCRGDSSSTSPDAEYGR
jgi:hypothetical protein